MRINSDVHLLIFLLLPEILSLKLTRPGDPNSILYVLSDGTTPVNFFIRCEFYNSVKKGLLRPFIPNSVNLGDRVQTALEVQNMHQIEIDSVSKNYVES